MTAAVQAAANPTQALYASLNGTTSASAASAAENPQDRFLKLLVTQLRNQDPLNPMDNAQMTSQLAQLSTVDGINKLNATLQSLVDASNADQAVQAAALVGQAVLVPGSSLTLQGGAALGGVELAGPADSVKVSIKDSSGLVVKTLDLGALEAGSHNFTWNASTDGGATAADGSYTITINAVQGGKAVSATALALGIVSGVTTSSQGASLNVGSLGQFKMSDVREII